MPSPSLIDTTFGTFHQDYTNLQGSNFAGSSAATNMYNFSGHLYCILWEGINTSHARCFKSVDAGFTWTPQDTTHEPGTVGGIFVNRDPKVFYPGSGTLLYVYFTTKPVATILSNLNTFDTATDTWGTQSVVSGGGNAGEFYTQNCVLSGGDQYIFHIGVSNNVVYSKFSGGVWSGPTLVTAVVANVTGRPKTLIVDPATDIMHLVYQETNSVTNISTLKYIQISAVGVPGAPTTLQVGAAAFAVFNTGAGVIWNGQLIIPFQYTGDNVTSVFSGTPLNAPVWSTIIADPGASTITVGAFMPFTMVDSGNNLQIFWGATSAGNTSDKIWQATNSGSGFTAPFVFYNDGINPPLTETPPGLVAISSAVELGGLFRTLWDGTTNDGTPTFFDFGTGGFVSPIINNAALIVHTLPGPRDFHLCRYGRPVRCHGPVSRLIVVSKDLVKLVG